ncbi:MAG: hypothetical protein IJO87_04020 [Eggerthellaceae bacterium]|nr:hypothetical protein [Eggerthellaceae bacterium]
MGKAQRLFDSFKNEGWTLLFSLFFALTQLVGYVCSRATEEGNWELHWPPAWKMVLGVLAAWVAIFAIMRLLFWWFDRQGLREPNSWKPFAPEGFFRRHCFIIPAVVIALCWLPYLLVYLPGSLPWDGVRSMNQFITDAPLENHHPVVMNLLYAGSMVLGRTLYSDNLGVLIIVLFQSAVCIVAFALSVRQLTRMDSPRWLVVLTLVFFALHPMWGASAQVAFKDTLFNGVFCCFVLAVVCLLYPLRKRPLGAAGPTRRVRPKSPEWSAWALLTVAALALCFTRNNGIYIALPTLLVLLAYHLITSKPHLRAARRFNCTWAVVVLAAVLGAHTLAYQVIYPHYDIKTDEIKEMMSVPFQQTARYLLEHPDDVTPEEREAIEAILPYEQLPDLYLPDLSDPVKESMHDEFGAMTDQEKSDYFAAWFSMGLRHPVTYIEATLANIYAYFYPWHIVGPDIARPVFSFYILQDQINQSFDVHYVNSKELRDSVTSAINVPIKMPIVCALYSPATFILLALTCVCYALRKRRGLPLIVAIPFAMLLITTLAGPLNGHLRYILPIAAALPLLVGVCIGPVKERGTAHDFEQ